MYFEFWQAIGFGVVFLAFGYAISEIRNRTKRIEIRLGRLSRTFLKIENELSYIQMQINLLADRDDSLSENMSKYRSKFDARYKNRLELGFGAEEILRGLEEPDFDDDPAFWKS